MDEMTGPTDMETLRVLREIISGTDPVPTEVIEGARAAFAWRTIDSELAPLTADSSDDDRQLVGVRGDGGSRLLAFESSTLSLVVELGDDRRLLGQLTPPGPGQVEVRHGDGHDALEVDDVGRFRSDPLPPGPMSLRCVSATSQVETAWVLI